MEKLTVVAREYDRALSCARQYVVMGHAAEIRPRPRDGVLYVGQFDNLRFIVWGNERHVRVRQLEDASC